MGTSNCSDEFKQDAVHQITVRGYPVREVWRRLGVSKYSLSNGCSCSLNHHRSRAWTTKSRTGA